ncbi:MAG: hypothetical protein Unbinned4936contig1000_17 [Prokaryotic dsDNA virus sp.]|nr:MAG: hypothetical protein Unbinned4936contig1000_17 [Prokaryotic dsDNA virus sp.]|tara:strand:+ start:10563 stop:10766 length:204 start_codon:yes stop_codon:yes gene_type:complete
MKDIEKQLHKVLAEQLLARVESGEATASELNVARQFLKDNGIDGTVEQSDPLASLVKVLPFTDKEAG